MPREVNVEVAIVLDAQKRFLVVFNDRWRSYCFPMKKRRPTDPYPGCAARVAVSELGLHLGDPTAKPLDAVSLTRTSQRDDRRRTYHYFPVQLDYPRLPPLGTLANPCGFLGYEQLQTAALVTWSTRALALALVEHPQTAVAVPDILPNLTIPVQRRRLP